MLIETAREWSNTVTKHVPFGERSLWALLLSLPIAYLFTSILAPYFVTLFFNGILVDVEINATGKKKTTHHLAQKYGWKNQFPLEKYQAAGSPEAIDLYHISHHTDHLSFPSPRTAKG